MLILLNRDEIPDDLVGYFEPVRSGDKPDVWPIATAPYSGAHFATFPPALVEPCVKAGTSERGVCPEPSCGKPWVRVTEPTPEYKQHLRGNWHNRGDDMVLGQRKDGPGRRVTADYKTTGWQPTCAHTHDPIPATVLDPFAGSGTTLQVARQLGRAAIGLDLSPKYLQLARQRLGLDKWDDFHGDAKQQDEDSYNDLPLFQ